LAHYCSDRYQEFRDKAERILKSNEAMLQQAPFVFATAIAGGYDAVRGMREVGSQAMSVNGSLPLIRNFPALRFD